MPSQVDVAAYLERIDCAAPVRTDATTLCTLHLAHLYTVPFENLDVHLRHPIVLDIDRLYHKIVVRRRGGFCYELNGLFSWLLHSLGYDVSYLSARVSLGGDSFSEEFDHLVLQVRTTTEPSSTWLVDVGFGDSFQEPLNLHGVDEPMEEGHAYWLIGDGDERTLWRRGVDGSTSPQYRFTLQPRQFDDFADQCMFNQSSPESTFTQKRICTLAIPGGRVSLTDSALITTLDGRREERPVGNDAEYAELLLTYFGVDLTGVSEEVTE